MSIFVEQEQPYTSIIFGFGTVLSGVWFCTVLSGGLVGESPSNVPSPALCNLGVKEPGTPGGPRGSDHVTCFIN